MKEPNDDVSVVIAVHSVSAGGLEVLGVFESEEEANRLIDIVEMTEPKKNVSVFTSPFWQLELRR